MKEKKVETVFLILGYFIGFEKYGIDIFYNRKYQKWLLDNSTDAESLNSENNNFHAEYDEKGFITNAKFTAYHNSIPLTENDFITIQIKLLNKFLDLEDLKNMELMQIQYFKKYLEKRIRVIQERNQEHNKSEHELFDKFDLIRFGQSTDYEITLFLKEFSNNYDIDLLKSLQKDIEFYLFVEVEAKQSEFTSIDIENAVNERLAKGLEIPYYKTKPIDELTEKQKENRKRLESNGFIMPKPSVNLEQLLFPFEFFNIYRLKNAIKNKISDLQKPDPKQTVITQEQTDIDIYFKSYKQNFFSNHTDLKNKEGKENLLFYGKMTAQLLNRTDEQLKLIENLNDKYDLLRDYNKHLYYLITHTIQLYKTINEYHKENNIGYNTIVFLKKEEVFSSLKSILGFSEKIKDEVILGNIDKAIRIKNYFLLKFDVWIAFLDNTIGIDIYKSPLKIEFEKVKATLENAINLDELKIINELSQNKIITQSDLSKSLTVENKIIVPYEPFGEIFTNNGFKLFDYILSEYVKPKNTSGRYEDLSYYYRCLFEDKYIHQKPEPFKLWFMQKYTEEFSKIKTKLQTTNAQRKKDYSTALEWFRSQNE